jgi:hypothetical protein
MYIESLRPLDAAAGRRVARALLVLGCTLVLLASLPGAAAAQAAGASAAAAVARPDDVASIDAIIAALYASISGPVGQPRDWQRLRSLLVPGAQFIPTGRRPSGEFVMMPMNVDGYIERSGQALVDIGFRELEITRRTEQYGNIAHTFSSYDSFRGTETTPFARGINSIQLWNDGTRWWVVNIFWEAERPDNPLPARYLRAGG